MVISAVAVTLSAAACSSGDAEDTVSAELAESEGWEWPLTVDSVDFVCGENRGIVVLSEGKFYALNGIAKGQGYDEIDPIWKESPDVEGLKVDISGLTGHVLEACGY